MSQDLLSQLIERRELVKQWAVTCADGVYSEKVNDCYQGDATLFSGVACLAAVLAEDKDTIVDRC